MTVPLSRRLAACFAASSFVPRTRALLHAAARGTPSAARVVVAPRAALAQTSATFEDAGLDQQLVQAVRASAGRQQRQPVVWHALTKRALLQTACRRTR